jgi:hypothetical protein
MACDANLLRVESASQVLYASRRFVLHTEAVAIAEEVRGDCERDGWTTLTP